MKVRKTIIKGEKTSSEVLWYGDRKGELDKLPSGTPIEIVALVEPERKLIRPEGAVWRFVDQKIMGNTYSHHYILFCPTGVAIASVYCDTYIAGNKREYLPGKSIDELKTLAEHALADAEMHWFGWEPDEPDQSDAANAERLDKIIALCNRERHDYPPTQWHKGKAEMVDKILKIAKGEK